MFLRYLGAVCAIIYGLLSGYAFFASGWYFGFYTHSFLRLVFSLIALVGAGTIFQGKSRWYLVVAMGLIVLPDLQINLYLISEILDGTWKHQPGEEYVFMNVFLPIIALIASLLADGGWKKSIRFLRRWPHSEDA